MINKTTDKIADKISDKMLHETGPIEITISVDDDDEDTNRLNQLLTKYNGMFVYDKLTQAERAIVEQSKFNNYEALASEYISYRSTLTRKLTTTIGKTLLEALSNMTGEKVSQAVTNVLNKNSVYKAVHDELETSFPFNLLDALCDEYVYIVGMCYKWNVTDGDKLPVADRIYKWNKIRQTGGTINENYAFLIEELIELICGEYWPEKHGKAVFLQKCPARQTALDVIKTWQEPAYTPELGEKWKTYAESVFEFLVGCIGNLVDVKDGDPKAFAIKLLNKVMDANDKKGMKKDNQGKVVKDATFDEPVFDDVLLLH